jgi:hypothetical protein
MPSISNALHSLAPTSHLERVTALFKDSYGIMPTVVAGGSVVMLAPESIETEVMEGTAAGFARRFDRIPPAWPTHASGGACLDLVA